MRLMRPLVIAFQIYNLAFAYANSWVLRNLIPSIGKSLCAMHF
jgi:hypothetical protein